jgi:formate hydrogenlyase transcriptional activator
LLVAHFLRIFAERQGKSIERVPADLMTAVERYSWPGNIRELQNFIERSVILTRGTELQVPVAELENTGKLIADGRTLADANRVHIMATLRKTNWVVGGRNGAATRLGVNRTTLIAKMRKLGICRDTAEQRIEDLDSNGQVPVSWSCDSTF